MSLVSRSEKKFQPALKGKKIPILTLDNKWHLLFKQKGKPAQVEETAAELNELLVRQGQVNTQVKKVKTLKKQLMDGIMVAADEMNSGKTDGKSEGLQEKKLKESKRLIEDCNQKLEKLEDEQLDLPRLIEDKNYDLMLQTMEECYITLAENTSQIQQIDEWVKQIRIELKKRLVQKQEMEETNRNLYAYMHDIFGSDVIELFDMKYDPKDNLDIGDSQQG